MSIKAADTVTVSQLQFCQRRWLSGSVCDTNFSFPPLQVCRMLCLTPQSTDKAFHLLFAKKYNNVTIYKKQNSTNGFSSQGDFIKYVSRDFFFFKEKNKSPYRKK